MPYTYQYPRPALTADCVVVATKPEPSLLLVNRLNDPYKGQWALPGGFMNMDETAEQCARRELQEETGLTAGHLRQIGTYSAVDRDPRGRTVTVAYLCATEHQQPVEGHDDAAQATWWPLSALPPLAFDHAEIVANALQLLATQLQK